MLQIATGSYVGDGAPGRTIQTGLSGVIRMLRVVNVSSQAVEWFTTEAFPAGEGFDFSGIATPPARTGLTLTGGDFVVGVPGELTLMNQAGKTFQWFALSE